MVAPCTPVSQVLLVGARSSHPCGVDAIPLRVVKMSNRSQCCVVAHSRWPLTRPCIGWRTCPCCTRLSTPPMYAKWVLHPSEHQPGPMFHFPLMRASLLASQKANRVLLRFCVALRLTHFRYTDHVRIMMRHVLVVSEAQYWVLLVGRLA